MAWLRPAGAGARFTSDYGPRPAPGGVGSTWHRGVDLAPPTPRQAGFPVLAATDGSVVAAGYSSVRGYWLVQRAADGSHLRYQHLASAAPPVGAWLAAGQRIGAMGRSGVATGEHLHLETFHPGAAWTTSTAATDPELFFLARGVNLRVGVTTVGNPGPTVGGALPDITVTPIPGIDQEDDMPYSEADLKRIVAETLAENLARLLGEIVPRIVAQTLRDNLGDGGTGMGAEWWIKSSDKRWAESASKNIGLIAAANHDSWWAKGQQHSLARALEGHAAPAGGGTPLTPTQVQAAAEAGVRAVLRSGVDG